MKLKLVVGFSLAALTSFASTAFAMGSAHAAGDWWTPLDHYCERVGVGFWAEPFNALTNGAFIVTAAAILMRQRRVAWSDKQLCMLAVLTASVGVGSFLFHTLANRWSLIADIVPIAVVVYSFFFVALTRFLRLSASVAGLSTVALLVLSPTLQSLMKPLLGSSASYTPGLIATFGVAVAVPVLGRGPMPRLLVAAGIAFATALVFRMLDAPLCGSWPTGTHFIWHLLNALALGLALFATERVGAGSRLGAVTATA
ncbi:ceramidase [Ensifer sesbaniae]|uniref:ceramidase domain-containing protein n=1 Tax=Ensifer sesbaniae TaxID=1214071 RepID=UPI002000C146|nr:ceramidase [Ensifer sesbaniae]